MMAALARRLFAALNHLIPKDPRRTVFSSFPDMSDNAQALYAYMVAHPRPGKPDRLVWLVEDPSALALLPVGKAVKKHSLRGIWHFWRAKYVFHTHGLFGNIAVPGQINVSLWHGMPLKCIINLDKTHEGQPPFDFTFTLATSPLFQDILSHAFGCPPRRCLVSGLPRNDLLFNPPPLKHLLGEDIPDTEGMLLWMPTYRKSVIGDIRQDGAAPAQGIGFLSPEDLQQLNGFLKSQRLLLVIKVHPMQDRAPFSGIEFSHIRILTDWSGPLYPLVGQAKALLTDYSSVYVDYLLLDRPIGFITDDWDAYQDSRGFVFENPKSYMPGPFLTNYTQLTTFIRQIAEGCDPGRNQRRELTGRLHTFTDGQSCERVLNMTGWYTNG